MSEKEEAALDTELNPDVDSQAKSEGVLAAIEAVIGSAARVSLHGSLTDDFDSPVISPSSDIVKEKPQGTNRYKILGEIARGGMGVVVRTHDNDLGRDVALKILRREVAERPEIMRRFVEEAQIGGQLQHPGIVPIYELGLMADQRPFFAMKLVKGQTLAARFLELQGSDRRQLLDVFEAVCQTMAYAHTRGVIHRDLKPANVMVGAFGEVQVVDWGLAKVLAAGGVADERRALAEQRSKVSIIETVRSGSNSAGTQSLVGSVMGTPAYMPPEQARGEVNKLDQRSDVFSLGAMLCELLTGEPPYTGTRQNLPGEAELILAQAANAELDDALSRLDDCDADAELVDLCKECMAPAPGARPGSARTLAKRMSAYLSSLEERARQAQIEAAETRARAVSERKAHRLTLALAATVLVAIVGGGGSWAWRQSERADRMHQTEKTVLAALTDASVAHGQDDLSLALAHLQRARDSAGAGEVGPELMSRVDSRLAEIRALKLERELRERLDEIRRMEWSAVYDGTPKRQVWARQEARYVSAFEELGFLVDSGSIAEVGREMADAATGAELALALDAWANVRGNLDGGSSDRSRRLTQIAIAADDDPWRRDVRVALLSENEDGLTHLAATAGERELSPVTAVAMATALTAAGRPEDGAQVMRDALRFAPSDHQLLVELGLNPATPANDAVRFLTAAIAIRPSNPRTHARLGRALGQSGALDEAIENCELALELDPTLPAEFVASAHSTIAEAYFDQRDYQRSLESFRRALEVMSGHAGAHYNLGRVLLAQKDFAGLIESAERAIELDPDWARPHFDIAFARMNEGDPNASIRSYVRGLELDPGNGLEFSNLGQVQVSVRDMRAAIKSFEEAVRLDPSLHEAHYYLANTYRLVGMFNEAYVSYQSALELDPRFVNAHYHVADMLYQLGEYEPALEHYETAIEIDPDNPESRNGLAWLHAASPNEALRDPRVALRHANRAIELDPNRFDFWNSVGVARYRSGRYEEALEAHFKSMSLDSKGERPDNWLFMAMSHSRLGETEEALAWWEQSLEWQRLNDPSGSRFREFFEEAQKELGLPVQ